MNEYSSKFLTFVLIEKKPKTEVWSVRNKRRGYELGKIRWDFPWRQYCFFINLNTFVNLNTDELKFSMICFEDINNFLHRLMNDRIARRLPRTQDL